MTDLNFSQPPFDVLTPAERQSLKKNSKIRYLELHESLTFEDKSYLFVVIKGQLQQVQEVISSKNAEELKKKDNPTNFVGDYNKNDWFIPQESYQYISTAQTLLLQIKNTVVEKISAQNHLIRQLLNGDLPEKIRALQNRKNNKKWDKNHQGEAQQLLLQSVTNIPLLPVHIINENSSIVHAAKLMTEQGIKHVLVRRYSSNDRHPTKSRFADIGILTDTDICRAVSEGKNPEETSCLHYTNFKLKTIDYHQDVSEALLTMIRYHVHRLPVVNENSEIIGVLGQSDLLAYISHHSQLITVEIQQAKDISDLQKAVDMIGKYIRTQQKNGIKVGVISRMVQTLNAQVFAKIWHFIVPEIVYENTCLIVMGSEGRGEQIMRTDQDNALIIRNGFKDPDLAEYAETFNQTLAKMGYPLCDGNIMMTNPMWRQPINRLEKQINSWFSLKDPMYSVYLSAILDNAYVCGDERLLNQLREHLAIAHDNADPMMIRQFARIALQYGEVNQWWQRLTPFKRKEATDGSNPRDIDLKKAGIFPIVHGVRAMAMEHNIYDVTSTKARLNALARIGVISTKRAENITEALHFFMAQRLSVALITEDKLARQVDPTTLSALERDLMKECLNMVKSFKNELISHYQLNYS